MEAATVQEAKSETIAIVGFKKRGNIRYEDFEPVLLDETATQQQTSNVQAATVSARKASLLKSNAAAYSKQLCKYAANCS